MLESGRGQLDTGVRHQVNHRGADDWTKRETNRLNVVFLSLQCFIGSLASLFSMKQREAAGGGAVVGSSPD